MNIAFIESEEFGKERDSYFMDDDDFRKFQDSLLQNPRVGDVEPGLGSVRKVRWASQKQGKGKSGGIRIYYVYVELAAMILLIGLYGKSKTEILTYEQRKNVAMRAREFKEEILALQEQKHE